MGAIKNVSAYIVIRWMYSILRARVHSVQISRLPFRTWQDVAIDCLQVAPQYKSLTRGFGLFSAVLIDLVRIFWEYYIQNDAVSLPLPFQGCKVLWRSVPFGHVLCVRCCEVPCLRGITKFLLLYGLQHCKQPNDDVKLVLTNQVEVTWRRSHEHFI